MKINNTIVNGKKIRLAKKVLHLSLIDWLREELDLTGVKNGCGIGVCGACTILINDKPVKACLLKVEKIIDKKVLTIEGLANTDGSLHPLQQSFIDFAALQCGFCTPGMILAAHALLLKNSKPTRDEIKKALAGNLCRCTGYQQIIDAVRAATKYYQKK